MVGDSVHQHIDVEVPPSGATCVDCDAADPPGWWVHLRRCTACGHIGCCDTSPSQHATAHADTSGHRVITSYEPGEDWFYDYDTGQAFDGPELVGPDAHPEGQSTPGPEDRLPADWPDHIHR